MQDVRSFVKMGVYNQCFDIYEPTGSPINEKFTSLDIEVNKVAFN